MNYIPWILFIFGVSFIFVKASELLLPEKYQKSLKQALRSIENEICQRGPERTALSPIYYMSLFLDIYLGKKLVSIRSMILVSILATILIISSIWLTNIPPNKGDFLEKSPFKLWNQGIESFEKLNNIKTSMVTKPDELEQLKTYQLKMDERKEFLLRLSHLGGDYIFATVLFLSCSISIIVLTSLTTAITRQVLREMTDAKGIWTLIGGTIINILLVLLLGSFFELLLSFVVTPGFWTMWDSLPLIFMKYFLVAYPIGALFAHLILPGWIKIVVLVSLTPIILLAFSLCLSAVIFLFRKPIHLTIIHLLKRSLEYKAGPISYFATLLALVTFIINMIYNHFQ